MLVNKSAASVRLYQKVFDLPRALLLELPRDKDTLRCGALGAEDLRHRQEDLTQTLILRFCSRNWEGVDTFGPPFRTPERNRDSVYTCKFLAVSACEFVSPRPCICSTQLPLVPCSQHSGSVRRPTGMVKKWIETFSQPCHQELPACP